MVIFSHQLLSQKIPSWVFSEVINAPLWSNVISWVLQWREKYIVSFGNYIANLLLTLLLHNSDSEADSGKLLTSAWELFYRLMNAPLRCYYFFGVKMTS